MPRLPILTRAQVREVYAQHRATRLGGARVACACGVTCRNRFEHDLHKADMLRAEKRRLQAVTL